MNQDKEASISSSPSPESTSNPLAEAEDLLLNQCKQLREEVESAKNLNTLIFYSKLIFTAFEAIDSMINKFNTLSPTWVVYEIEACEYCCEKACDINKEIRMMFSNAIWTSSPTNNTGSGSKKVLMWKKQCDKNLGKIENIIKNTSSRDISTEFNAVVLYGISLGVSGVLASLYKILILKESVDDEQFINIAEGFLEDFEMSYRIAILNRVEKFLEGIKDQKDLLEELEESNLKNSQEVALEKNLQEAETGQKKLQEEETQKKLQEDEALKKIQEEEAIKKLQEEETQKRLQEDEALKKTQEEEAIKKLQEEETQKNSQEAEINKKLKEPETHKKLLEDEALKKLQEEKNLVVSDENIEFKMGELTFKMKNGVLDQVN